MRRSLARKAQRILRMSFALCLVASVWLPAVGEPPPECENCPRSLAELVYDDDGYFVPPGLEAPGIPAIACLDPRLVLFEVRSFTKLASDSAHDLTDAGRGNAGDVDDRKLYDARLDGIVRSVLQWDDGQDRPATNGIVTLFALSNGVCKEGVLTSGNVYVVSLGRRKDGQLVLRRCSDVKLGFGEGGKDSDSVFDFETGEWRPMSLEAFEGAFQEFLRVRARCPHVCDHDLDQRPLRRSERMDKSK